MQSGQTDQCANPMCRCSAQMSSNYCGEYCELHAVESDSECRCGHPECEIFGGAAAFDEAPGGNVEKGEAK